MVELTFDVPDRLIGQFYLAVGAVLKRAQIQGSPAPAEPREWGTEANDSDLATSAWRKFSPRAQAVFSLLMENSGTAMQADQIAAKIGLASGRHSLAGVVAWPSRQCAEMGMAPPFRFDAPAAPGDTGSYWMDPETARLFVGARDRSLATQADITPHS